jgi:homoserine kinase type II
VELLPPSPPFPVLKHFAARAGGLAWRRAPAGFSGAVVWRGDAPDGPRAALKCWPPGVGAGRVRQVHAWQSRAGRLPFVPSVFAGEGGETAFAEAGRVWDCCRWQPGEPRAAPATAEAEAAGEAVARLHLAWEGESRRGPCPAVRNRLQILAENEPLLRAGPGALPPVAPELDPLLRRALLAVRRVARSVAGALEAWSQFEFPLQPCLRDLRAEHVLFAGGRVAGLIDFGAAAVDWPAVDLARLLLDWPEVPPPAALAGYRRARPHFDAPGDSVQVLLDSGAACSVLGWLARLAVRREAVPDAGAIASRLARLVARAERIGTA